MTEPEKPPMVSIITVVLNGEAYLEKTIKSVLEQINVHVELIVIDGGSTDSTVAIIRKYEARIRWISEPDQGIYHAMNKGILMARGDWLNFLNGGDYFHSPATLTEVFQNRDLAKINFLYGDSINVYGNYASYIKPSVLSRSRLRKYLGICHQAVFVRRSITPPYDLNYRYKAEYNWVIDIVFSIPEYSILYLGIPVVYYALGGFSEKGALRNLGEFMKLTRRRFGWGQVLLNSFMYLIVFLRFVKYSIVRPKQ